MDQTSHNKIASKEATPFSVLMSVYARDNPALFRRAIQSVFDNSIQASEFLIVQDGPLPNELTEIISEYQISHGLVTLALKENQGLAKALNHGLEALQNEFVFRADADDFNMPHRFEVQIRFLEEGYDLVGSAILEMEPDGEMIAVRMPPLTASNIRRRISTRNPFNHMTVAYRRSAVLDLGGYPNIYLKEDYALWAAMIAQHKRVINLADTLVQATAGSDMYRRRGGLNYVRSEIDLQRLLVSHGLQSSFKALIVGSLRSSVFLAPSALRGMFYQTFLRHRPKN